ncbi:MAG: UV DNA damage repair endonuclease UvsE [Thermoplasmatota archaeon]
MRIGYPCINRTLDCSANKTFRLKSYSEDRLIKTLGNNLHCLKDILQFNVDHKIYFFRITSDLVPFASHEINAFDWQGYFKDEFEELGDMIEEHGMRVSMHPDQFIVLNSIHDHVYERSVAELRYHADALDLMKLDATAKIQVHVGGVYGDKEKSMDRFAERYNTLDECIKRRLVVENDDVSYTIGDCLHINEMTGIPVVFDYLHHQVKPSKGALTQLLHQVNATWKQDDGLPIYDYSSQEPGERAGKHAEHIDIADFIEFIERTEDRAFDVMLEIKDKEQSAIKAINATH